MPRYKDTLDVELEHDRAYKLLRQDTIEPAFRNNSQLRGNLEYKSNNMLIVIGMVETIEPKSLS